jgi:hypothetical protein
MALLWTIGAIVVLLGMREIIERDGFGYDENGELKHMWVAWLGVFIYALVILRWFDYMP